MKISPVQSFAYTRPQHFKTEQTISNPGQTETLPSADNYGRALVHFRGISPDMQNLLRKTPFEEKLAAVLKEQSSSDLLAISKNAKKAFEALDKASENFAFPFKRLMFLKDSSLDEDLFIIRTPNNQLMIININDDPLPLNGLMAIVPNASAVVDFGDSIFLTDKWVELKDKPDVDFDIEECIPQFVKITDYTEKAHDLAVKHNKSLFKTLMPDEKKEKRTLTFANVGGQDTNIEQLKKNVLYPMKYPEVFEGFMQNHGVVLSGPPGTGKSLLAQALATEANASVFELCATDLSDKYVGESEKKCRELFRKAVDGQPSIIYFDEFDALGKSRGGQDVHNDKLLNQLLSLMSDLEKQKDNVFVIAATNRKEDLDPAIMRSGRFGLQLEVNPPDLKGTKQILSIHTKDKPIDKDISLDNIAQRMFNKHMTGADIAVTVKNAFSQALERAGIYESMAKGCFSPAEMDYCKITEEDFIKAIENFKSSSRKRNPVGFNK